MDNSTLAHFQAWLNRHVRPEEHLFVFDKISQLWIDDPEFCSSKSWAELRDIAKAW
jgi:hypothetical protein